MRAIRAVPICILIACATEQPSLKEYEVRLSAADAWSGDTLRITSQGFVGLTPLPKLRLGPDSVALVRVDDSTLAARMPDTAVTATLALAAPFAELGTVTVHGFASARAEATLGHGPLTPYPAGVDPGFLGVTGDSLVLYNVRSGSRQLLLPRGSADQTCSAPFRSLADPQVVLVSRREFNSQSGMTSCYLRTWNVVTGLPADTAQGPNISCGPSVEVSPLLYLASRWNNLIYTARRVVSGPNNSTTVTYQYFLSPPSVRYADAFTTSPSGDRIVPYGGIGDTLPLIDPRVPTVAATITGFRFDWNYQAAFADLGATLYVGVRTNDGQPRLLVADGVTGVVRDSVALAAAALALLPDNSHNRLFVVEVVNDVLTVRVLSTPDLHTLAVLTVPAARAAATGMTGSFVTDARAHLALSPVDGSLYLVMGGWILSCPAPSEPAAQYVFRFTLVP